jgi:hypothetical protein
MITASVDGALTERYEAIRRWWCSGAGDGHERFGLVVLLQRGMSAWMHHRPDVESRDAFGHLVEPPRSCEGRGDVISPKSFHVEIAYALAAMAIETMKDHAA